MDRQFQPGDRVRIVGNGPNPRHCFAIGATGVVDSHRVTGSYHITSDKGLEQFVNPRDLELISLDSSTTSSTQNTLMRQLTELSEWSKRLFNDDKKALWRAGYIDDSGKPTDKGMEALRLINWEANEPALIEKAKTEIAEAEASE